MADLKPTLQKGGYTMQKHKISASIPYGALEPLAVSLLKSGQTDLAGMCVMFDAQIAAMFDRQAPNYGLSVTIDPAEQVISAEIVPLC